MEKLAQAFARYITKDTNLDYEVVKYGVDAIFSTVLCFGIALLVCLIMNNLVFGVLFIIFLTPIKMQFLGYHCNTMIRCICTYSLCTGISLFTYNHVNTYNISLLLYYIIMFILCIIVKSELNKKNKIVILIYLLTSTILFFGAYKLFLISLISLFIEILLVLPVHIKSLPKVAKTAK